MQKVTGVGGIFIKALDPIALGAWYDKYLGTQFNGSSYVTFKWADNNNADGQTTFSFFNESEKYFYPSNKQCMLNFRVDDLEAILLQLKDAGVWVDEKIEASDYGKFGWCMDLDGNKIELWQT